MSTDLDDPVELRAIVRSVLDPLGVELDIKRDLLMAAALYGARQKSWSLTEEHLRSVEDYQAQLERIRMLEALIRSYDIARRLRGETEGPVANWSLVFYRDSVHRERGYVGVEDNYSLPLQDFVKELERMLEAERLTARDPGPMPSHRPPTVRNTCAARIFDVLSAAGMEVGQACRAIAEMFVKVGIASDLDRERRALYDKLSRSQRGVR